MREPADDPVLISARREAIVVFVTWGGALTYTVTYCHFHGYNRRIEDLEFVFGLPDWVFWGVAAPWAVCFVVAYWFSYRFMRDHDLGEERVEDDNDQLGTPGR